jgi:Holliday junction resolvase RusA-like endonuclease
MSRIFEIFIRFNPHPAARQTRRDSWDPKPEVIRYRTWRDQVVLAAKDAGIREGNITPPVSLSFVFGLPGHPAYDLDNLIKGVKDALVRGRFLPDDTRREVPLYRGPVVAYSVCDACPRRTRKRTGDFHPDCGKTKACDYGYAWIGIKTEADIHAALHELRFGPDVETKARRFFAQTGQPWPFAD